MNLAENLVDNLLELPEYENAGLLAPVSELHARPHALDDGADEAATQEGRLGVSRKLSDELDDLVRVHGQHVGILQPLRKVGVLTKSSLVSSRAALRPQGSDPRDCPCSRELPAVSSARSG